MLSGKDRGVLRAIEELLTENPDANVTVADITGRHDDWDGTVVAHSLRKLTEADCVELGGEAGAPMRVLRLTHRGRRERGH